MFCLCNLQVVDLISQKSKMSSNTVVFVSPESASASFSPRILGKRSANYSATQLDCLLTIMESDLELAGVKFNDRYRNINEVKAAWEAVAEKITVAGGCFGTKRSGRDIKRKWADLKSRVRAKVAAAGLHGEKTENCSSPFCKTKFSPIEERVLGVLNLSVPDQQEQENSSRNITMPSMKVFSFQHDSNSEDRADSENDDTEMNSSELDASELLEIKSSGSEDKKRRLSEAFSSSKKQQTLNLKENPQMREDEQINELYKAQLEINTELRTIKDILKKCHLSIEKLAVLKRAELRLKCAKYGVEFEDLFD